MAISFDQVNVWVRQLIKPTLYSSYVQMKPLLYVMAGSQATNRDKLGDPQMGVVWGGKGVGRARLKRQAGSYEHMFRYQDDETDDAANVGIDGNTPTASKFGDDLVKFGAVRWTDFWGALKVRKDRLDAAKSDLAIGEIMEDTVTMGFNKYLEKHQLRLWSGTLTESQQDAEVWADYLGVQHTCDGTGSDFYGRVDRSSATELRGKEYAATALATANAIDAGTTIPKLRMIRYMKTENSVGGICNRFARAGRLCITTPSLWNVLATEAEGNHTIYDPHTMIPGLLHDVGMEYPIIVKDTTLITYDPDCPSGELYLLTPDFWVFEVEAGNNFVIEEWQKKWLNDEGGAKYYYTYIHAKTRLLCYRPDLQVKITGLTTT